MEKNGNYLLKNNGCLFLLSRNKLACTPTLWCVCARGQMWGVLICLSLSLTLSPWASAVAFLVPLVLQILFSFTVLAFQSGCSKVGGKGFFPVSQEGGGLENVSRKALH